MTKTRLAFFCCLLTLLSLAPTIPASSAADPEPGAVSIDFFYDTLAPHGRWIEVANYGPCFQPTVAQNNPNWRPYSDGYWSYTDGGWAWVSYEDFGWATYHYGRWMRVNDYGWTWVPGTEWAPAWVAWREGSGGGESGSASASYIGWAPLPPPQPQARVGYTTTVAVDVDPGVPVYYPEPRYYGPDVEVVYGFGPAYWNFCETRYFGAPLLASVLIVPSRNFELCGYTRNITNVYYVDRGLRGGFGPYYFNGGPNFIALRGRTERPIPQLQLQRQAQFSPTAAAYRVDAARGALIAPSPRVVRAAGTTARPIPPNLVQGRAELAKIDRGGAVPANAAANAAAGSSTRGLPEGGLGLTAGNEAAQRPAAATPNTKAAGVSATPQRQAQVDRRAQAAQQRQAALAQRQAAAAGRRQRVAAARTNRSSGRAVTRSRGAASNARARSARSANIQQRRSAPARRNAAVVRGGGRPAAAPSGGGRRKKPER